MLAQSGLCAIRLLIYNSPRFDLVLVCGRRYRTHQHARLGEGAIMISPRSNAALKEWAVVCRALADGRQTLLIRKGGIEEIKDGFQVTHRDFWLFPTYVHQKAADLIPAVHPEFEGVQKAQPPSAALPFHLYATVEDAVKIGRA